MKMANEKTDLRKYQLMVFTTMFVGYACYGYNRKGVSLALPALIEDGLTKEHAGELIHEDPSIPETSLLWSDSTRGQ